MSITVKACTRFRGRVRVGRASADTSVPSDESFGSVAREKDGTAWNVEAVPPSRNRSFTILVVADLFHPFDGFTVEIFLNGDVCHGGGWRCAMPMLLARREPDHITGMNHFNRTAFALHPPATGCNN